jgi:hypothetical protein
VPRLTDAEREQRRRDRAAAAREADHAAALRAAAHIPPLTPEQRARLRALLAPDEQL